MTEEDALVSALLESPGDPGTRLVYADWLEEHGDSARARALRVPLAFEERYELQRRLWHDGPYEGWSAFDQGCQSVVWLYVSRHRESIDQGYLRPDELSREALLTARFRHPNLPALHDLGFTGAGLVYLARPPAQGTDLGALLRRRERTAPCSLVDVVRAVRGACRGLAEAHRLGVLHGNLAPHAVLVGGGLEEVQVTDWGAARRLGEQPAPEPEFGHLMGKPAYMPPEFLRSPQGTSTPADVYGLGGLLYLGLYGRPPNQPEGVTNLIGMLQAALEPKQPLPLPVSVWPTRAYSRGKVESALRALERICLRALASEPARRWPSVAKLGTELAVWLDVHANQWQGRGDL
ncbi:MAG: TIGR02996 domain-containing protein [Gemmataceae bacterium]|nr:TIGR02996 domain-containing protein [Gemmataceae bacterium]